MTIRLRRLATAGLAAGEVREIRALLAAAFDSEDLDERFSEEDWGHAVGGVHFVLDLNGEVVAHASIVERDLRVGDVPLRTGYVEAVAVAPAWQGRGNGTVVMRAVGAEIAARFELGALGTAAHHFYERLGWRTWRGPSFVRDPDGTRRPTPDEDGHILVLLTPGSPALDLYAPISCEWRPGDAW